jgi:tetratricopeptide (TPR) repeat protein
MGTEKTNWDPLMELYRANKMKEAFIISQQILTQKPQNDTAIYFHGVISYELKNYKTAKTDYTKITQNKESVFYYDAAFRLGFTLKNLNENKAAQRQFETITNNQNNPYNEKAKVVLEYLK